MTKLNLQEISDLLTGKTVYDDEGEEIELDDMNYVLVSQKKFRAQYKLLKIASKFNPMAKKWRKKIENNVILNVYMYKYMLRITNNLYNKSWYNMDSIKYFMESEFGTKFYTSKTTSAGVSSPSGDQIELWCEGYSWDEQFKLKPKQTLTGDSYTATKGKVARNIQLTKCIIIVDDDEALTNTESLNNKLAFLRQFQRLSGQQAYLIIASEIDSTNLELSESSGSAIDYMKGYITRVRGKPMGNFYYLDISFVESTLL